MNHRNPFENLWFFDLLAFMAIVSICVIMVRIETARKSISKITLAIENQNAVVSDMVHHVIHLDSLLPENEEKQILITKFNQVHMELIQKMVKSHDFYKKTHSIDSNFNFAIYDSILFRNLTVGASLLCLHKFYDSLITILLDETRIEKKPLTEEDICFPVGEIIPYGDGRGTPEQAAKLKSLLADLQASVDDHIRRGFNIIRIIGHTDTVGTVVYNRQLSFGRASYLSKKIEQHILSTYGPGKPIFVQAFGYGEYQPKPLLSENMSSSNWLNWKKSCRRVEVLFSREHFTTN